MNEEYLNMLNEIRDTLEEIKALKEDLHDLLNDPVTTLEYLEGIRDTLAEIKEVQEVEE